MIKPHRALCHGCCSTIHFEDNDIKHLHHSYIDHNVEKYEILRYVHCDKCGKDQFVNAWDTNLSCEQFKEKYKGRILYSS